MQDRQKNLKGRRMVGREVRGGEEIKDHRRRCTGRGGQKKIKKIAQTFRGEGKMRNQDIHILKKGVT